MIWAMKPSLSKHEEDRTSRFYVVGKSGAFFSTDYLEYIEYKRLEIIIGLESHI